MGRFFMPPHKGTTVLSLDVRFDIVPMCALSFVFSPLVFFVVPATIHLRFFGSTTFSSNARAGGMFSPIFFGASGTFSCIPPREDSIAGAPFSTKLCRAWGSSPGAVLPSSPEGSRGDFVSFSHRAAQFAPFGDFSLLETTFFVSSNSILLVSDNSPPTGLGAIFST